VVEWGAPLLLPSLFQSTLVWNSRDEHQGGILTVLPTPYKYFRPDQSQISAAGEKIRPQAKFSQRIFLFFLQIFLVQNNKEN
jgi:hypothetical protein